MDGFLDTTGTVSSGRYKGKEVVFHEEGDPNLQPNKSKRCTIEELGFTSSLGDPCWHCGKRVFLRPKPRSNTSNSNS